MFYFDMDGMHALADVFYLPFAMHVFFCYYLFPLFSFHIYIYGACFTLTCVYADIFSIFLMLPFTSTVLGLLVFNWYPSKVFVGDSFTYFAGMLSPLSAVFSNSSLSFFHSLEFSSLTSILRPERTCVMEINVANHALMTLM